MRVTVQQRHICFVIGLFACRSIALRPLSRICAAAEQLQFPDYSDFFCLEQEGCI